MKKKYLNFNPFFIKIININEKINFLTNNFKNLIILNSLSFEDLFIFYIFYYKNFNLNNILIDTNLININNIKCTEKLKKNFDNFFTIKPNKYLLENYIKKYNLTGFYNNIFLRKLCCQIRKILESEKEIKNKDVIITGLTRYQSLNRKNIKEYNYIKKKNLLKFNIIYNWFFFDIFYFVEKFDILIINNFDKGYLSVGCEPCTNKIFLNQNIRKGRWWWELTNKSECGLHE